MKYILILLMNFSVFATKVSVGIMDITDNFSLVTLDDYTESFNPCQKITEGVSCTYNNEKIFIKYNIYVTISEFTENTSLEFYIDSNPISGKEYDNIQIKRNGSAVTFPEIFIANENITYEVNFEITRFGANSKPEYNNLFDIRMIQQI